ncbi:DUF3426 domain-containing protein [Arhodomonas sp. AD133]|uniref:DUF3426 domain-containing protein n=1 Tax=Arhodomonas sp. AD133 TaxID=3415009 RepID=UPI003EBC9054
MSERPPMQTRCPGCGTVFRVTEHQLQAAGGECRCGLCGRIFDARPHGYRASPPPVEPVESVEPTVPDPALEPAEVAPEPVSDDSGEPLYEPVGVEPVHVEPSVGSAPPEAGGGAVAPSVEDPDFVELSSAPSRRRWPWALAAVLLVVALAGQVAWFQRDVLLADARARGWAEVACEWFGCRVGLVSRPEQVAVVERTLEPETADAQRLRFTARIVNRHETPIAWPQLGLRLRALNGRIVGERWFAPGDYLETPPGRGGMPVDEPVAVRATVADPDGRTQGFEVEFR